jgi:hypothetical protein
MTTELRLLVASVVLGLVHLIASSHLISWQRGYCWTAGSREETLRHCAVSRTVWTKPRQIFLRRFLSLRRWCCSHASWGIMVYSPCSARISISGVASVISLQPPLASAWFVRCCAGTSQSSVFCFLLSPCYGSIPQSRLSNRCSQPLAVVLRKLRVER